MLMARRFEGVLAIWMSKDGGGRFTVVCGGTAIMTQGEIDGKTKEIGS